VSPKVGNFLANFLKPIKMAPAASFFFLLSSTKIPAGAIEHNQAKP
jgi:hypothetical protein